MSKQLALNISIDDQYTFDNFWPALNFEFIELINNFLQTQFPHLLSIIGEPATGKTHLMHAIADKLKAQHKTVMLLPMKELIHINPNILDGVEHMDFLMIDDIDAIKDHPNWQEALFHCYNRCQDKQCKWLITACESPTLLNLSLKDLQSRLSHGITWALKPMNDEQKHYILIFRANKLGLEMSQATANYLLNHYSRDLKKQMDNLNKLEQASLTYLKKLTIPFIKQTLSN